MQRFRMLHVASMRDPEAFYREFRGLCRPPMILLASLEIGDLWFYDGLSVSVTVCVGARCLLVAYDSIGSRDVILGSFRDAHAWLHGERAEAPENLHLVYAARESSDGELRVALRRHGDWEGILNHVPLPPGTRRPPWADVS